MIKITTLHRIAEIGATTLWLLRKKVAPKYYFYLEWPPAEYWETLFRWRDWVIAKRV